MERESIKKALECHYMEYLTPTEGVLRCKQECPYSYREYCTRWLAKDALIQISEDEAFIKELKSKIDILKKGIKKACGFHKNKGRIEGIRDFSNFLQKRFCHDPAFLGVEQRLINHTIELLENEFLREEENNA